MDKISILKKKAKEIRKLLLEVAYRSRSGHIGSSLSTVEIITALYFSILRVNPKQPAWKERDFFILSKGHGCLGYYAALALRGFFPKKILDTFLHDNTLLSGHPTTHTVPGIEVSTGSLGHGISIGAGMAYGFKKTRQPNRVIVMVSDGECDEGSTWEAVLSAAHLQLGNLAVVVDYNKRQAFGKVDEVLALEPFTKKWEAFGWNVLEINGHDFKQILQAFAKAARVKNKPTVIIANTIKGKGIDFMENTVEWHYLNLDEEKLIKAVKQL